MPKEGDRAVARSALALGLSTRPTLRLGLAAILLAGVLPGSDASPADQGYHYNRNAETYMGSAFASAGP